MKGRISKSSGQQLLFFLKLEKNLPFYFVGLARALREREVTLIPVTVSQLLEVARERSRVSVFLVTSSFKEKLFYEKKIHRLLRGLVIHSSIELTHASSFQKPYFAHRGYFKQKNYHFLSLPIGFSALARLLHKKLIAFREQEDRRWPGGKGATLSREVQRGQV